MRAEIECSTAENTCVPKSSYSDVQACLGYSMRTTELSWSLALEVAKRGFKVAFSGWNDKGMWIAYNAGKEGLPAENFWNEHARKYAEENGGTANVSPYLLMKMSNGDIMIGWSPSQVEMTLDKWCIIE